MEIEIDIDKKYYENRAPIVEILRPSTRSRNKRDPDELMIIKPPTKTN